MFDKNALENAKMKRVAQELELQEATDKAIRFAKEFTIILEDQKITTRCLVAYSMNKTYRRLFPKVFEALEKLGV